MLTVDGVSAAYGRVGVLSDVSLEVGRGEVVSLLGANGAGKTTLFRVISGLIAPSHGRVVLDGRELNGMQPYQVARLGIGQVPEGRQVFAGLTVLDNLMLAGAYGSAGGNRSLAQDQLRHVYELFPILAERSAQRAGTLSGGQQQMVSIARALMTRPRLLLLDEPSLGLAPRIVADIFQVIRRLNGELALTVLLIEQNVRAALMVSHRAYILEGGRIALNGSADAVLTDPRVRELYLGKVAPPTDLTHIVQGG